MSISGVVCFKLLSCECCSSLMAKKIIASHHREFERREFALMVSCLAAAVFVQRNQYMSTVVCIIFIAITNRV
jgi:hypothetical protein